MIFSAGQTGVLGRGYQAQDLFNLWQGEQHYEEVSMKRVMDLRIKIQNEIRIASSGVSGSGFEHHGISNRYANT